MWEIPAEKLVKNDPKNTTISIKIKRDITHEKDQEEVLHQYASQIEGHETDFKREPRTGKESVTVSNIYSDKIQKAYNNIKAE